MAPFVAPKQGPALAISACRDSAVPGSDIVIVISDVHPALSVTKTVYSPPVNPLSVKPEPITGPTPAVFPSYHVIV